MDIKCKANMGAALSPECLVLGYTEESEFYLIIGKNYQVFAMALWHSVIVFLIVDESGRPAWQPSELFSLVDARLPEEWFFTEYSNEESGVQAVWGYEALIFDPDHYDLLTEYDPGALRVFEEERRKRQPSRS